MKNKLPRKYTYAAALTATPRGLVHPKKGHRKEGWNLFPTKHMRKG